ncbi:MAG: aminopeptidase P N-terminal domain-containing protein, partial [Bryobacteraceae bacterium]
MTELVVVALLVGLAPEEHRARREELRKLLDGGALVLRGGTGEPDDLRTGFYQEPNFLYLTGWREPGAALLVEPAGDTLFVPPRDAEKEKWSGPKTAAGDPEANARTGFGRVRPSGELEAEVRALREAGVRVLELADVKARLASLRMRKSAAEIERIARATAVTVEAHRAAWRRAGPGVYEYQVAAAIGAVIGEEGCERPAYVPVVASGPNSVVLHYWQNRRRIESGDLLLMDAGAECGGYASDVTRTIPVSGKFSARQREIYDIVLGAQKAVLAAARPGMTIGKSTANSLYQIAYDYFESRKLAAYFTHGIS